MIFYGNSGEFATNRDQQQLATPARNILQAAALVYVNMLMIQTFPSERVWH